MLDGISVVVTCYNLERYIDGAIESIIGQVSDLPCEILVVDDCSTDTSVEIISRYQQVRLLRTPVNSGVLLATVLGLQKSTYDVVAFLDGDDLWRSDKLGLLAATFAENPRLGLVTHDLRYIDSEGTVLSRASRPSQVMPSGAGAEQRDRLIRDGILEQGDYVWLGSAYAIRRSLVNLEGFCTFAKGLPDARNTYQDWPLAVWCAMHSSAAMDYIPEKLFDYRLHQANHSGDARTPAKAMRNVNRTLNTLRAIEDIVQLYSHAPDRAKHAIQRKRRYYEYVHDLYEGRRLAAFSGFVASQRYVWRGDVDAWKEYARFILVQILGLNRFLRWMGR